MGGCTDARPLEPAGKVEGRYGPERDAAVKTMKYRVFVTASEEAYEWAGAPRTPKGRGPPPR